MYQMIAHDGVRFIKLVLLFKDTKSIISKINEGNKFMIKEGIYVSKGEGTTQFLIDFEDQIQLLYNDSKNPKLGPSSMDIKGLTIKYTGAPRFVFLNEKGTKSETVQAEEEQEDEFEDLFKKFDV